jgi:hypothetical protein
MTPCSQLLSSSSKAISSSFDCLSSWHGFALTTLIMFMYVLISSIMFDFFRKEFRNQWSQDRKKWAFFFWSVEG